MASPFDLYTSSKMGPMHPAAAPITVATRFKINLPPNIPRALFRAVCTSEWRYLQGDAAVVATAATAGRVQANQDWPIMIEGPSDQFISIIHAIGEEISVEINIVSSVDDWTIALAP